MYLILLILTCLFLTEEIFESNDNQCEMNHNMKKSRDNRLITRSKKQIESCKVRMIFVLSYNKWRLILHFKNFLSIIIIKLFCSFICVCSKALYKLQTLWNCAVCMWEVCIQRFYRMHIHIQSITKRWHWSNICRNAARIENNMHLIFFEKQWCLN